MKAVGDFLKSECSNPIDKETASNDFSRCRDNNSYKRSEFCYLVPKGEQIEILEMKDLVACALWEKGHRWLDMPQKTLPETQQLRAKLLANRRHT
jgi:hypothetical protein